MLLIDLGRSTIEPIGVVGWLIVVSFFLASIVALFSHCDSTPASSSSRVTFIAGKSAGTLAEAGSLRFKCRRSDSLFDFGESGFDFDFSLTRDEADVVELTDALRDRPNKRLVFFSEMPSVFVRLD
jgi:hypothetical protein